MASMADASALWSAIQTELQSRGSDAAIATLAAAQHGVVSRAQLLELGLSASAIRRRVQGGRFHIVYRGVYAVGHKRLTREGRWMAAVLAAGADAVLSHRSAAALWGLRQHGGRPEVTVPPGRRGPPRLTVHRSLLPFDEVTTHNGIATTTAARTILDCAAVFADDDVERLIREAEFLRLDDRVGLNALLERYPRRQGTAAVRAALARAKQGSGRTRLELEARFKSLISKADLPPPDLNATLELGEITIQPDFLWREKKLIVELDSHQAHYTTHAFENDRARDRAATVAGYRVIRVTARQLDDEADRILSDCQLTLT